MYQAESKPIPTKIRDGLAASIRALGPGQSFLIPQSDVKPTTRKVAHREAVRLSIPVSIRKVEGGLRVFRLESWPKRDNSGSIEAAGDVFREERRENHAPEKEDFRLPGLPYPNPKNQEEKFANLAALGTATARKIDSEAIIESDPEWIDAGEAFDDVTGEMVAVEKHIKTGKYRKK